MLTKARLYEFLYFNGEFPEGTDFESAYQELITYIGFIHTKEKAFVEALNRVSQLKYESKFISWVLENKEQEVIDFLKLHKYVFDDVTIYVSEINCLDWYDEKPVNYSVLNYLGINKYNYFNTMRNGLHISIYYKKDESDLIYWSSHCRYFNGMFLYNIIADGEECPECGHIHVDRNGCPKCAAFSRVNAYSTQVQDILSDATTDKHYGIEIEIEGRGLQTPEFVKKAASIEHKYLLCKSDGSLRNGVELVTKPASYAEHLNRMPKVLDSIKYNTSVRTGMHVHVNKDLVDTFTLLRLFKNVKFWGVIEKCSGRGKNYHRTRPYARFNTSMTPPRGSCLNPETGKGTVEFRMFAAPRNIKLFHRHMEFVKSCVDFSNWEESGTINDADLAEAYLKFVKNNADSYKLLVQKFKYHKWFEDVPVNHSCTLSTSDVPF